jgi:hypothetical protein
MTLSDRAALLAAALWWGSMSVVGFVVVPMLFANLPTTALAGGVAARLFSMQSWLSVGCGIVLLLLLKRGSAAGGSAPARATVFVVVAGMLLALLLEHAVAPRILARENLRLWHGLGTAIYSAQWLCAGLALWRLAGRRQDAP